MAPLFIVPLPEAVQGLAKPVHVPGLSIPKSPLLSTVGPVGEEINVLAKAAKLLTVKRGTVAGFEYAYTLEGLIKKLSVKTATGIETSSNAKSNVRAFTTLLNKQ